LWRDDINLNVPAQIHMSHPEQHPNAMIKCRELVVCELLQVCNVTVKASGEHRGTVVQVEYLPSSSTVCTPLLQVLRCCNQCKALPCKMQTTVAFIIHSTDYDVWLPGVACCNCEHV
jgi:hypothetical protein